jgi:hypothetical protein
MSDAALQLTQVMRTYRQAEESLQVLRRRAQENQRCSMSRGCSNTPMAAR